MCGRRAVGALDASAPWTNNDACCSAQLEYFVALARECLLRVAAGRAIRREYLIVEGGALAGTGAKSYTADGSASPGSA